MRFIIVLAALVAAVAAIPTPLKQHAADQDLLKKQQDIIYLFEHITGRIPNEQFYNLGVNYDIEQYYGDYSEPHIVQYYFNLVKLGNVQPQGTAFSLSVSQLRKEVALLTRIFLSAKDYGVFIKTAAWARVHVNEYQFVLAFVSAILQHPETVGVIPPALYEIFPQHYFDARIIKEAQDYKIYSFENQYSEQSHVIPVNYTDYLPLGEHQLSYFTQDIGLALYYAYASLAGYMIPEHSGVNIESQKYHIGRGSHYFYLHQQLLAHYNLQRLSSGLGPIGDIDYEHVKTPYHPHLQHINGLQFAGRSHDIYLTPYYLDLVKNVHALERRIMNAIDAGYVITPQQTFLSLYQPQGLSILGELIEGTGRSVNPRYYGSLQAVARQLLGNAPELSSIYDYTPSALDVLETSVRDPVFYKLYKRVVKLFERYQHSLPAYQYDDLVVPGVVIEKIAFPNLVTYIDESMVDLHHGIVSPSEKAEHVVERVQGLVKRLNHKPYEYQIIVNSDKVISNAVVRVYLAPKYDYDGKLVDISLHRNYFVELDQFVYELVEGKNVIVRDSHHAPHFSQDYPSVHHIKTYLDSAIRSQNPYYITEPQQIFGFPARLSIPKGRYGGLPLQLLVVISSPESTNIPYGPVIPAEYQTYQKPHFQVVSGEHYKQIVQGQAPIGHQTYVEVLPYEYAHGVYGQDVEKAIHYYGHYFYQKYPSQYPVYHHLYEHGIVSPSVYGQSGYGHFPAHHQQQHYGPYHHQSGYIHHGPVGSVVGGSAGGAGSVPYGMHQGGIYQGEGVQHGVYQGEGAQHGVYQGEGAHHGSVYGQGHIYPYGGVSVEGGHHGAHHEGMGQEGYNVYKHNAEYLKKYYHGKHISEIIGGYVSLDGKPLGYPLDRPLGVSALYVPNIKVADVIVYHQDSFVGTA
ncbi:hypothetical protein PV325_008451 [Microctonus aethiopoides]|nr:hypothetical protein PV325_008451 [Microctonus aethiopoides]